MEANGPQRSVRRRTTAAVRFLLLVAVLAIPATSVAKNPRRPMPAAMKARLAATHYKARVGCHRVTARAKRPSLKRRCGRLTKPKTLKRTMSLATGYQQYGFVCRFNGSWSAQLVIPPTPADFRGNTKDYLLWMQFPPGLDQLTGGPYVMTVFASVYCDVYGKITFPTPSAQTPPPITPDVPTASDSCGVDNDRLRIPDAVPVPLFTLFGPDETQVNLVDPDVGMMYVINGIVRAPGTYGVPGSGSRTVTIDAVPTTGRYTVLAPRHWEFTFTDTPCPRPVTPVRPPVTSVVCGPNNDVIGRIQPIEGLDYDYGSWSGNSRTVTATVENGYVIPGDADGIVRWNYTDADTPCPIPVTTRAPTVREVCGPTNDVITIPTITGVAYTVGDWQADGTLTVTAAAKPGYVIVAGAGIAWKVTDGARDCPIVNPPIPRTRLSIRMVGRRLRAASKPIVYGLFIRNVGSTTARNVVIRDPVPKGLALVRKPVDGKLRRGVIYWQIGDLQPGSWIYLNATLRSVRNRTIRRCNVATAVARNASRVTARRCTRFIRVAAARFSGVTG